MIRFKFQIKVIVCIEALVLKSSSRSHPQGSMVFVKRGLLGSRSGVCGAELGVDGRDSLMARLTLRLRSGFSSPAPKPPTGTSEATGNCNFVINLPLLCLTKKYWSRKDNMFAIFCIQIKILNHKINSIKIILFSIQVVLGFKNFLLVLKSFCLLCDEVIFFFKSINN